MVRLPWSTTAMTSSARLIWRARSIVLLMPPTINPRTVNLPVQIGPDLSKPYKHSHQRLAPPLVNRILAIDGV